MKEEDDMQEKIKKLLAIDAREHFTVNKSKFECHFWKTDGKTFSEWRKDENSSSFFCEAKVIVYSSNGKSLEGLVLVQKNDESSSPLSAVLYVKPFKAEKWQSMHTITSMII